MILNSQRTAMNCIDSLSRTKIFIRYARTLFATEDAFEICKHELGKKQRTEERKFTFSMLDFTRSCFCYSFENTSQI